MRGIATPFIASSASPDSLAISKQPTLKQLVGVCALLLGIVMAWTWFWPYTGDGDSALHYLCARDVWTHPSVIFGSWSRPMHKALILLPAAWGNMPARTVQALICIALAWQTVSLAKQVGMPNSILAAPLLLFQPYVFALASDTMTELPMALATIIALRLWLNGRIAWSCLVVSFLPALRPEGFFLIAMWGILLLLPRVPSRLGKKQFHSSQSPGNAESEVLRRLGSPGEEPKSSEYLRLGVGNSDIVRNPETNKPSRFSPSALIRQRWLPITLLGVGIFTWFLACWITTGDFFYFIHVWSWPMQSYETYPAGPIYHYVAWWPAYCGIVLIVPFMLGIKPSLKYRGMGMVWAIWLLVFLLHTLMFWLHKFASSGLLRILACTGPMTALVCLAGLNAIGARLARRGFKQTTRRRLAIGTMILAMVWSLFFYLIIGEHYHCLGYERIIAKAKADGTFNEFYKQQWSADPTAPRLIAGDKLFVAMLGQVDAQPHYLEGSMDRATELKLLAAQPIGSVGAWDSEQSFWWHTIGIDELPSLGYTILYEYDQTVLDVRDCIARRSLVGKQRFVLFRKDRYVDGYTNLVNFLRRVVP